MSLDSEECPPSVSPHEPHPEAKSAHNAHVLFLDIVKFSTREMAEQVLILRQLQEVIRSTESYQRAKEPEDGEKPLIACSTGDGVALVFFTKTSVPAAECAEEISKKLKGKGYSNSLKLRIGIHTGPVFAIKDINGHENVAGEGINTAQRVMDCGDEGHILLSKVVADCLRPLGWRAKITDLKQVRVKHDFPLDLCNLCDKKSKVGNSELPEKVRLDRQRVLLEKEKLQLEQEKSELEVKSASLVQQIEDLKHKHKSKLHAEGKTKKLFVGATVLLSFVLIALAATIIYFYTIIRPATQGTYQVEVIPIASDEDVVVKNCTKHIADSINVALNDQSDSHFKSLRSEMLTFETGNSVRAMNKREVTKVREALGLDKETEVIIAVEGKRANGQLVIIVTFLDTQSNHSYPELNYSVNTSDSSAIQNIISDILSVYNELPTKDERERRADFLSKNNTANELYLDGLFYYKRRKKADLETALKLLGEARKLDPDFVLAYSGLADCYTSLSGVSSEHPAELRKNAEVEANNALVKAGCDTGSSSFCTQVRATHGVINYWLLRNWQAADEDFKAVNAAKSEDPSTNFKYGMYLIAKDKKNAPEAAEQLTQAVRIAKAKDNKRSKYYQTALGQIYYFGRQYDKAVEQLHDLKTFPTARRFLSLAYEQTKNYDDAIAELTQFPKAASYDYYDARAALGHLYALRRDEGWQNILKELTEPPPNEQQYISNLSIAIVYAGLIEGLETEPLSAQNKREMEAYKRQVTSYLDKAIKQCDVRTAWLEIDPRLEVIQRTMPDEFKTWSEAARNPSSCTE